MQMLETTRGDACMGVDVSFLCQLYPWIGAFLFLPQEHGIFPFPVSKQKAVVSSLLQSCTGFLSCCLCFHGHLTVPALNCVHTETKS